jgi:hypothetical protein
VFDALAAANSKLNGMIRIALSTRTSDPVRSTEREPEDRKPRTGANRIGLHDSRVPTVSFPVLVGCSH